MRGLLATGATAALALTLFRGGVDPHGSAPGIPGGPTPFIPLEVLDASIVSEAGAPFDAGRIEIDAGAVGDLPDGPILRP